MQVKICLVGCHGTGKSKICKEVGLKLLCKTEKFQINDFNHNHKEFKYNNQLLEFCNTFIINEQFREVVNHILGIKDMIKQTEEITSATYGIQLYFENLYAIQGKRILCDRSVLDTFVYYDYFNKIGLMQELNDCIKNARDYDELISTFQSALYRMYTYSKIYLIEPSDREIENDGFRMTDKKQQLEVHKLFLEYFKHLENVEIINQEDAHKEGFVDKVVSAFIL